MDISYLLVTLLDLEHLACTQLFNITESWNEGKTAASTKGEFNLRLYMTAFSRKFGKMC